MGLFQNIFGGGKKEEVIEIFAPAAGKLVPLSEVSDPTFSEGIPVSYTHLTLPTIA